MKMHKLKIPTWLASFIFAGACLSCHSASSQTEADLLMNKIATATYYSWGMVGTPAKISDAENATRQLRKSTNADQIYTYLLKSSNKDKVSVEGKLYMVCTLASMDIKIFSRAVAELKINDQEMSVLKGDILSKVSTNKILNQIQRDSCEILK